MIFLGSPGGQLGHLGHGCPQVHGVLRQYGLLLVSSVIIALLFARRDPDRLSAQVALALALYHIGPVIRSLSAIWARDVPLVIPMVFFGSHAGCLFNLTEFGWAVMTGQLDTNVEEESKKKS